jgi:hypothetical protein
MDLLSEHSEPFSATWPSSGTTRSGVAFELPTPALHTLASASSSSPVLPTPLSSDDRSSSPADQARRSPQLRAALLPTPMTSEARGIGVHGQGAQDLRTTIALLKTPLSNLGQNGGSQHPDKRKAGGHGPTLADEVEHLLPTPSTANAHGNERNSRDELLLPGVAVALLPTPAVVMNDGEQPATWLARRERVKARGINGNGMGMPLPIALLLLESGDRSHLPSSGGRASPDE